MDLYHARVQLAHDQGLTEELEERVTAALGGLQPALEESEDGDVEVHMYLAAETLMEATISAVSGVWTAAGGEPVAVGVERQATDDDGEDPAP